MNRKCEFSPCGRYRYTLWREFDALGLSRRGYVQFVGLNPSTATDVQDDPTVRRCIAYAKAWGFGAFVMTNIFAFRATDPRVMKAQPDPIGPDNDRHLKQIADGAGIVVAAWGSHGEHLGRGAAVARLIPGLHCLHLTKAGHPGHPLYLKASLAPVPWNFCEV